jgi:hypothetical protein
MPVSVDVWRSIITGDRKSWVLFAQDTCVVLVHPDEDLVTQAVEILRKHGPARAGGPAGDFGVIALDAAPGWVVTGHHPDVLTYVAPDEVGRPDDLAIGLTGRGKRNLDGHELQVGHVKDRHAG